MLNTKTHTYGKQRKGCRKVFHGNTSQNTVRVATLISDRTDFRPIKIIRDKEGHYIVMEGSIIQEDMTIYFLIFKKIYLFLERGEGREKERERNSNVWLPLTSPQLGIWPATQACALTENRTSNSGSQAGSQSTELHQPGHNL